MSTQEDAVIIFNRIVVVWVTTIAGWTISEWAAAAAFLYTCIQIVLVLWDRFKGRHLIKPPPAQPTDNGANE